MKGHFNNITIWDKNNILLSLIIIISSFCVLAMLLTHFIFIDLSRALNLDMIFFTICLFAIIKKNLNLAKLTFSLLLLFSLISITWSFQSYNTISAFLVVCFNYVILLALLWGGILILSKSQKESWLINKNPLKMFPKFDSNTKRNIGVITAFYALLQFIPYHPHVAIAWLLIYIVSIIKGYTHTARIMLILWVLPYIVKIGEIIYMRSSMNIGLSLDIAIFAGIFFLISNSSLLYIGIMGSDGSEPVLLEV